MIYAHPQTYFLHNNLYRIKILRIISPIRLYSFPFAKSRKKFCEHASGVVSIFIFNFYINVPNLSHLRNQGVKNLSIKKELDEETWDGVGITMITLQLTQAELSCAWLMIIR